jgi:hypothetical protein
MEVLVSGQVAGALNFAIEGVGRSQDPERMARRPDQDALSSIDAVAAVKEPSVPMIVVPPPGNAVSQSFDVRGAYGAFKDGLSNGFYSADLGRLRQTLAARASGAEVSAEVVTAELLNVSLKMGLAESFAKMASKAVDGLQSLVMRQG